MFIPHFARYCSTRCCCLCWMFMLPSDIDVAASTNFMYVYFDRPSMRFVACIVHRLHRLYMVAFSILSAAFRVLQRDIWSKLNKALNIWIAYIELLTERYLINCTVNYLDFLLEKFTTHSAKFETNLYRKKTDVYKRLAFRLLHYREIPSNTEKYREHKSDESLQTLAITEVNCNAGHMSAVIELFS